MGFPMEVAQRQSRKETRREELVDSMWVKVFNYQRL